MNYKIVPHFIPIIILLIVGSALVKQFDYQNCTFDNPSLASIYGIVVVMCIGFMVKKYSKK